MAVKKNEAVKIRVEQEFRRCQMNVRGAPSIEWHSGEIICLYCELRDNYGVIGGYLTLASYQLPFLSQYPLLQSIHGRAHLKPSVNQTFEFVVV